MCKKEQERAQVVKGRRIKPMWLQCAGQEKEPQQAGQGSGQVRSLGSIRNHRKVCTWVGGHWDMIWAAP